MRSYSRVPMQGSPSHLVVVVETVGLSGHSASPKSRGVCKSNHGRSMRPNRWVVEPRGFTA